MKLKQFFGIALLSICLFIIHACTSEFSVTEDDDALVESAIAIAKPTYCKYNVTKTSVEGLPVGGIACLPCAAPCAATITAHPVQYPVGTVIGHIDGKLANSDGKCKSCPSDGYITN